MSDSATEWLPTRESLLSRLRDWDDQRSWKRFFDTYGRFIYYAARSSGLSDTEAQDVVQDTVISVAKQMPKFRYDRGKGSFKGWLMQTTRWRIKDALRRRERESRLRDELSQQASVDDRGEGTTEEWERFWTQNLLTVATEQTKSKVDARQFQVFDLVVDQGLSVREAAASLGVSQAQVQYARRKVSGIIRRTLRQLEREGA